MELVSYTRAVRKRVAYLHGEMNALMRFQPATAAPKAPEPVREAAEQLRLCAATLHSLCAKGVLPHSRILNAIRIAPADLETFIAARRVGGASTAT